MSEKVFAPWSEQQVAALNAFQRAGQMHPFTCGAERCSEVLTAVRMGWICDRLACYYRQNWAHAFMAEGEWPRGWSF